MKLSEIDLMGVYRKWKVNLGPFQGYFRSTPFVSLQTYEDFSLSEENNNKCRQEVLNRIIQASSEDDFVIVDLPFDEILNLALVLNNEYLVKPIVNINLLFHPFGIMGNKDNISKLILNGLNLNTIDSRKFIMLIPYDRYDDDLQVRDLKDNLNNQYGIGEDDLPNTELLKELGYNKVVIFTESIIKDDLKDYIDFINKDIRVEIIKVML
ncbi:normocyte-binding protein [Clostridium sp.]|uniref:normocyte-binding protein n=1 Tax=Clostridium sp. TaxID=1506 RepID=UPI00284E7605|nr:normocyte-binding protein [Clostridium sp.]MDR3598410.1 normocyte-binding protein [Clostridium sp.]